MSATTASADTGSQAARAINQLGLELYNKVVTADGNLCLSPYSIQSALVMTYAGAEGATKKEMSQVLHYDVGDEDLHNSFTALNTALADITARTTQAAEQMKKYGGTPGDPVIFKLANRLFGKKGYAFRDAYLRFLDKTYNAPLEQMNFSDSPASTKRINDWVEEQTVQRIKNLIPPGIIGGATRLVLVNALYLKAPWEEEFLERLTKPEPFHIKGGAPSPVPTMLRQDHFGYAAKDGFKIVSIRYAGRDLQFVLFVPDEVNGLSAVEKKLDAGLFDESTKLAAHDVILRMPKFKLESDSIPLGATLQQLGLRTAFDNPPGSANFELMAARTPEDYLTISEVLHKTFIALDEKGTEAAAATAVLMAAGAAAPKDPPKPIEVRVDRPFLFAVQHKPSGAILFLGRVTDPR